MNAVTLKELGRQLREAERTGSPIQPLTEDHQGMNVADAYAVQEAYSQVRLEEGAELVGRKIGCTNKTIQERFSIDTPDYGRIFDDMVVEDGEVIQTERLIEPMAEPEIGFTLDRVLEGPGITREEALDATREVFPSIEIIDSRIVNWRIEFEDTVADNGSSARCVLGSAGMGPDDLDMAAERVHFFRDGEEIATGTGSNVLGHPAEAVAWLANSVAEFGHRLEPGEWVLSGSMTNAAEARPGETYEARFDTLGTISCRFA